MRVSWDWLCDEVEWPAKIPTVTPQAACELLTQRGLEVEDLRYQGQNLDRVVVVEIREKSPHPNSGRLSICRVSLDGVGTLPEIVCGAQNMGVGDRVPLATLGAVLPNGLKIVPATIRNVVSNGMLCARDELGLEPAPAGDRSHDGLWILPKDAPLGTSIAEWLGKTDWILEIKAPANRGDCLSHRGIARELAGALGLSLKPSSWMGRENWPMERAPKLSRCDTSAAKQLLVARVSGVAAKDSPEWLKRRLEAVGSRSINAIVDWTNWILLGLGQPVHAYDASSVEGGTLIARMASDGEVLTLLDGKQVELSAADLVIADSCKVLGLAGVMGGQASEVKLQTRDVILEVAEFEPTAVRRMAFRHHRRTDAAMRFEKGIDADGLQGVLETLVNGLRDVAGTEEFKVVQWGGAEARPTPLAPFDFDLDWARRWLGMDFTDSEARACLESLGCQVVAKPNGGAVISVGCPSFRRDLGMREDLAEEIARSLGLSRVKSTLPSHTTPPTPGSGGTSLEDRAKNALVELKFWETLSFSFQSDEWLARFGLKASVNLMNAMSQDQSCMTPSLVPGLIRAALDNQNRHFSSDALSYRIFELRPTFHRVGSFSAEARDSGIREAWKIAWAISGEEPGRSLGAIDESFGGLRAIVEGWFERVGTKGVRIRPWVRPQSPEVSAFEEVTWHPGQTAEVWVAKTRVGVFGRMHPALETELKARQALWIAEFDWKGIVELTAGRSVVHRPFSEWSGPKFQPWSQHPGMERDFALIVGESEIAEGLLQTAVKVGKPLLQSARVFDVYKGESVPVGKKSVAIRVHFGAFDRSLREDEVEPIAVLLVAAWKKQHGAELRG